MKESCHRKNYIVKNAKFRKGSGTKSYMTNGFLIYDFILAQFLIYYVGSPDPLLISSYVKKIFLFLSPKKVFRFPASLEDKSYRNEERFDIWIEQDN